MQPNRVVDDAAVNVSPNTYPFSNAEADEGANESPKEAVGTGNLQTIIKIRILG